MTTRSGPGDAGAPDELERCLAEPGYTPPVRALPRLVRELAERSEATALERALARAGGPALDAAIAVMPSLPAESRPRLLSLLVRAAPALVPGEAAPAGEAPAPSGAGTPPSAAAGRAFEAVFRALLAALDEPLVESRKLAARGLGKLRDERAEPRLLTALEASGGAERKAVIDALATLGGPASLAALSALEAADADLARRRDRARLMIERRTQRASDAAFGPSQHASETADARRSQGARAPAIVLDAPLGRPRRIALTCRSGLAALLAAELDGPFRPEPRGPARVDVQHAGTLAELLVARTALDVALVFTLPAADARPPEQRIADVLSSPECLDSLARWTRGVPRFRVEWLGAGHRRALSWTLARALRERTTAIVNDPEGAAWTLRAAPDARGELALVPRLGVDPRFAYRRADVPAASHPTLAAALARFASVRADDVVWDPFVGSGLELIECARAAGIAAEQRLWGSDLDPRALAAARQNLEAAGVAARLVEANALELAPPAPTLVITNPPMGRRVARDGSLGGLLDGFLEHAARVLAPGGRIAWLSPLPDRTERRARQLGYLVRSGPDVDMGGFTARLQLLTRPG